MPMGAYSGDYVTYKISAFIRGQVANQRIMPRYVCTCTPLEQLYVKQEEKPMVIVTIEFVVVYNSTHTCTCTTKCTFLSCDNHCMSLVGKVWIEVFEGGLRVGGHLVCRSSKCA